MMDEQNLPEPNLTETELKALLKTGARLSSLKPGKPKGSRPKITYQGVTLTKTLSGSDKVLETETLEFPDPDEFDMGMLSYGCPCTGSSGLEYLR